MVYWKMGQYWLKPLHHPELDELRGKILLRQLDFFNRALARSLMEEDWDQILEAWRDYFRKEESILMRLHQPGRTEKRQHCRSHAELLSYLADLSVRRRLEPEEQIIHEWDQLLHRWLSAHMNGVDWHCFVPTFRSGKKAS